MWSGWKTCFNDSNLSVCKLPTSTVIYAKACEFCYVDWIMLSVVLKQWGMSIKDIVPLSYRHQWSNFPLHSEVLPPRPRAAAERTDQVGHSLLFFCWKRLCQLTFAPAIQMVWTSWLRELIWYRQTWCLFKTNSSLFKFPLAGTCLHCRLNRICPMGVLLAMITALLSSSHIYFSVSRTPGVCRWRVKPHDHDYNWTTVLS